MYPAFRLDAVTHDKLPSATKVFNIHDFEYHLFIRVPDNIYREYELYELNELNDSSEKRSIPSAGIDHNVHNPWYTIIFDYLNKDIGLHTYRMMMVNRLTNHTLSLYFSYVVQNDNPEKGYVYMKR